MREKEENKFMILKKLISKKTVTLYNGKEVKEGDTVYFIDSDGIRHEGKIKRRKQNVQLQAPSGELPRWKEEYTPKILKKGTLFFRNVGFLITDYVNADLVKTKHKIKEAK